MGTASARMNQFTLPMNAIRAAICYGAVLRQLALPRRHKTAIYYAFPALLRRITEDLTNDLLGRLSREEAAELRTHIVALHRELTKVLDWMRGSSLFTRLLFWHWIRALEHELDRIGDIAETLAWGSEDELRQVIDSSIRAIEQMEFHLS